MPLMHEAPRGKAETIVARLRAIPSHSLNEGSIKGSALTTTVIADEMDALIKEIKELQELHASLATVPK